MSDTIDTTPKRNAYDSEPPPKLLAFMVTGWAPQAGIPDRVVGAEHFLARREAIARQFPGETLVVPTGREKTRANDTQYRFRPGTDFYYLTGSLEPEGVLVLEPAGDRHRSILYVEPNPGKSVPTFFTDRARGELWVGPRLGVPESEHRYAVDEARPLETLFDALPAGGFRALRGLDGKLDTLMPEQTERDAAFAAALSEMRLLKDAHEVGELERAIAATVAGFEDVVRALPHSTSERHVEGHFALRARVDGNDVGYNTIAAAGVHACILHWTANDGRLKTGDLLLLDAGVEAHTLYTADVTRTIPLSGTFSAEQRAIYDLVYAAQEAALARCAPGNDFLDPNRAAMAVLAAGLERLGILASAADALADEHQFYKRYSLHNVSHMLGLDVHDCAHARMETYKFGKLAPGMVLTVEPGLYFQPDDLTVPERYRGIGVRIEDDILITAGGHRLLSGDLPREGSAVEAWMHRLWS
ncbi:MAG: aminopeptidase P family protein [Candidatus Velthaea sp.]|jgi:Xaa-Pro aminopeptidase